MPTADQCAEGDRPRARPHDVAASAVEARPTPPRGAAEHEPVGHRAERPARDLPAARDHGPPVDRQLPHAAERDVAARRAQDVPDPSGRARRHVEPRLAEARGASGRARTMAAAERERHQPAAGEVDHVGRVAAAHLAHARCGWRPCRSRRRRGSGRRARGPRGRACPTAQPRPRPRRRCRRRGRAAAVHGARRGRIAGVPISAGHRRGPRRRPGRRCSRRWPRSPRRRGRTPRPTAPACPRRAGRG